VSLLRNSTNSPRASAAPALQDPTNPRFSALRSTRMPSIPARRVSVSSLDWSSTTMTSKELVPACSAIERRQAAL
jgi:hypothetical protein